MHVRVLNILDFKNPYSIFSLIINNHINKRIQSNFIVIILLLDKFLTLINLFTLLFNFLDL